MRKPHLITPEMGCVLLFSVKFRKVGFQSFYCAACEVKGEWLHPFRPFGSALFPGAHGAMGRCRYEKEEKVYPRAKHIHQSVPKELWMSIHWEDLWVAYQFVQELGLELPKSGFRRDGWAV